MNLFRPIVLILLCLPLIWACDDEKRGPSTCGNGVLDEGEPCDGANINFTEFCSEHGFHGGLVTCTADCRLDTSGCSTCGDGLLGPGEECDTSDFGDTTCLSLEHHGGTLTCTPGCRIDDSTCARCGDGLVQTEYGELVERSYEACSAAGHFGGIMATGDCQTGDPARCGDFRLVTARGGLKHPAITVDAAETVWIAGTVGGNWVGEGNAGCPRVEELTWEEDGPEGPVTVRQGYWTPAACDDAVLARAPWGAPVEPLAQSDDSKPPQALVDLDYRGFAVLRHDPEDPALSALELLDRTGGFQDGETVVHASATLREPPQLQVVWPEDLAVVALPASGQSLLEVTRYNADEGVLYPTATWSAATLAALHLEVDPASFLIRTVWNAAGELNAVVQLRDTESLETGLYVFALTVVDDTITIERHHPLGLRTDRLFHLEAFTASEIRTLALVRLVSVGEDTTTLGFHLFSDVGQPMAAWTVALPAAHVPEAAFHLSDGTWAIAGSTDAPTFGELPFPACLAHVTDAVLPIPFVLRTDAVGVPGSPEYFGADGLLLGDSTNDAAERACGARRHNWSAFGTVVYLSGTWDRAGFFCSWYIELMTEVLGEPLHECGIYVIRMSAPAPT